MPKQEAPPDHNPRPKHRFERYIDGEWWRFVGGQDFTVPLKAFRNSAATFARRNGFRCETRTDGPDVFLRFTPQAEQ